MPRVQRKRIRRSPIPIRLERREAVRVPVRVEVDYAAEDTFLFAYSADLSSMGIFVQTDSPPEPGTRLRLRFSPPGTEHPLELSGDVIWVNPPREGDWHRRRPGMGVRFADLTDEDRASLVHLVQRFAYLCEDSGSQVLS